MSVVASVKAYLVGASGVLAPLMPEDVIVEYSEPTRDLPRELVHAGTVVGPVELKAFSGGVRVKRSEDLTLMLHVRVYRPGQTRETTDARAVVIGDVITTYIAANPTLGGLAELKLAQVTGVELGGFTDDEGNCSTLDISVGLMSYLT